MFLQSNDFLLFFDSSQRMTFFHFFFQLLHLTIQITFRAAGVGESGQIIYFRQVAEKLRGQKGLSQKEPAGMIGVNPAQYGRVENNKVEPTSPST